MRRRTCRGQARGMQTTGRGRCHRCGVACFQMDSKGGGPTRPGPKAAAEAFFSPTAAAAHTSGTSSTSSASSSSSSSSSSGWKDRLKQRCLKRVHQERSRLVQELRGLKSPPPPGSASRTSALHSPSPISLLQPQPGSNGRQVFSSPSFMSSAVMSILQDEMRGARRTQVEGEAGGEELNGKTNGGDGTTMASPMLTTTDQRMQGPGFRLQQQHFGYGMTPSAGGRRSTKARLSMGEIDDTNHNDYLEWNEQEEEGDNDIQDGFEALSPEEQVELMQCIEEALQAEMRAAEEQALEEYSQLENYEIQASVEALYDDDALLSADDVAVLCPCCKANFLLCQNGEAFCVCGLRVEAREGGGMLAWLQERLAGVYAQHKNMCAVKEPMFFQRGTADLWVECVTCGLSAQIL